MNTLLIQGACEAYVPVLKAILESQQAYCTRHAITYMPFFGRFSHDRDPRWDRFYPMIQALNGGRFELVVWMDADALVVDREVDLRDATDELTHLGMVAHPGAWRDWKFHFNCGVMYVRNTVEASRFLAEVDARGPTGETPGWENQDAIHEAIVSGSLHVDKIRNRWNSCRANQVPHPVVQAFHGMGPEKALAEVSLLQTSHE